MPHSRLDHHCSTWKKALLNYQGIEVTDPHPAPESVVEASDACKLRDLLDRIGDKWSLLVVELLGERTHRFNELRRAVNGVSQRMLTLTLRQLERDGLVVRYAHPEIPPRVEYALTPLGGSLLVAVQPLVTWTRTHRWEIAAARDAYDDRATSPLSSS